MSHDHDCDLFQSAASESHRNAELDCILSVLTLEPKRLTQAQPPWSQPTQQRIFTLAATSHPRARWIQINKGNIASQTFGYHHKRINLTSCELINRIPGTTAEFQYCSEYLCGVMAFIRLAPLGCHCLSPHVATVSSCWLFQANAWKTVKKATLNPFRRHCYP